MERDRRRGPDLWVRLTQWLTLVCWGLLLVALALFHFARPEMDFGFLRYGGVEIRSEWLPELTLWLLIALWFNCLLTLATLVIGWRRNRRLEDTRQTLLWLLMMVLLGGLGAYYLG